MSDNKSTIEMLTQLSKVDTGLLEKLTRVQEKVKDIRKDSNNKHLNYKYLSLPVILAELKPLLEKEKLVIKFDFRNKNVYSYKYKNAKGEEKLDWVSEADAYMHVYDAETGEFMTWESPGVATNSDPAKAVGSMHTYTRRYMLEELLVLTGDMKLDPDNSKHSSNEEKIAVVDLFGEEEQVEEKETPKKPSKTSNKAPKKAKAKVNEQKDLEEVFGADKLSMEEPAEEQEIPEEVVEQLPVEGKQEEPTEAPAETEAEEDDLDELFGME